ncbi:MAG: tetratricopeptide repeat protein [Chthoniobacteraceae bacterium]
MPSKRQKDKNLTPLGEASSFNPASARAAMERMMRELAGGGPSKATAEERSQDLFYEAMEANTPQRMLALIKQALELDPDNVDARLFMMQFTTDNVDERIEALRDIVDSAARKLGPGAFEEYKPHFWGFIETRPYMRAREHLAGELLAAGRREEAVKEYEEMMELNPNDNQGVRYVLLPCYLALDRRTEARNLFKQYTDDVKYNTVFAWGLVLLRYLTPRKAGLESALTAARKQNAYMEAYIKGHRSIPKNSPGSYSPGSREEAICYAKDLKMAWDRHPEAVEWLVAQKAPKP